MQIFRSADLALEPAAHEDPRDPGCLKKVLVRRSDIPAGRLQMVNWVRLNPQRAFEYHYHEKMTEIFVVLSGRAAIAVDAEKDLLMEGDAVVIAPRCVHTMTALDDQAVHYLAMGIVHGDGGRTVVVADQAHSAPGEPGKTSI